MLFIEKRISSTSPRSDRSIVFHVNNIMPPSANDTVTEVPVGSPRYLYVKHSKYMDLIYKTDYDLLDFVFEEGQYVEPMTYLPIIPTVLCKNNIGVAVGYSMHNQAYNPLDIIATIV